MLACVQTKRIFVQIFGPKQSWVQTKFSFNKVFFQRNYCHKKLGIKVSVKHILSHNIFVKQIGGPKKLVVPKSFWYQMSRYGGGQVRVGEYQKCYFNWLYTHPCLCHIPKQDRRVDGYYGYGWMVLGNSNAMPWHILQAETC